MLYYWNFGDGSYMGPYNGPNVFHTYMNGTYTAALIISNTLTPGCTDTVTQVIAITNATCNLVSGFTYTVGNGGVVNFSSSSTGTNNGTTYAWTFGNGYISNSASPTVTFASGGNYVVSLTASNATNCNSMASQTVNVNTIPCIANAGFSMVPTGTPQYWSVIPSYPWNVINANWSWGDNTSTTFTLYTAHQYSAAAMYSICLSVTVRCGATASTCNTYSIYRGAAPASIIYVNIAQPPIVSLEASNGDVGVINADTEGQICQIYPNPSTGIFTLRIEGLSAERATVEICNLLGKVVYANNTDVYNGAIFNEIGLSNTGSGVYFVQVKAKDKTITRKIVISK
jgi:PKD repeat protein